MLTAMIVDDEALSIKMLERIVDWNGCGVKVIASAQDGQDSLNKFKKYHPQIIVTDIKMPNMNGLEFIRRVKQVSPETEFILVSAYADFDFAKKAIDMGCSNYILKPIDEFELENAIKKAVLKIDNKRATDKFIKINQFQKEIRNLYHFMVTASNLPAAKKSVVSLNLDLSKYALMCFIINETSINDYIANNQQLDAQMPYIMDNLISILKCKDQNILFEYENLSWTAIILDCSQKNILNYAKNVISFFQDELHMKINVCFTEPACQLGKLPELNKQLVQLRKYSFFVGEKTILGYGYNCVKSELNQVTLLDYSKRLESAIKQGNHQEALEYLNEVFSNHFQTDPSSLHLYYEFCYNAIRAIREKLQQEDKINLENQFLLKVCYQDLTSLSTIEKLKAYTVRALECISVSQKGTNNAYSKLVNDGIKYLQKNYNRNISLEGICNYLNISKNYFCYLFKRETGENLWSYLTQMRLNKAKELLQTTQEKTYAIAYRVGYDNPSYFSKLFKKNVGKSPNEFRNEK